MGRAAAVVCLFLKRLVGGQSWGPLARLSTLILTLIVLTHAVITTAVDMKIIIEIKTITETETETAIGVDREGTAVIETEIETRTGDGTITQTGRDRETTEDPLDITTTAEIAEIAISATSLVYTVRGQEDAAATGTETWTETGVLTDESEMCVVAVIETAVGIGVQTTGGA